MIPENSIIDPLGLKGPGPGVFSLINRFGWLREWELAQWRMGQQHEMLRRESVPQPRVVESTSREPGVRSVHDVAAQTTLSTVRGFRPPSPSSGEVISSPGLAGAKVNLLSRFDGLNSYASLSAAYSPASYYRTLLGASPEPMPTSRFAGVSEQLIEWQPYLLHVLQSASGLRVWIRDQQLDELSGYDLLARVRDELASMGLRLASFAVNGREIWRGDIAKNETTALPVEESASTIDRVY